MPPVCSKSVRRRSTSFTPNRSAMPGSHHTGSIAALVTFTSPEPLRMSLSGFRRPAAIAAMISGMFTCALVMAMVGRMSHPAASLSENTSAIRWPHGSSETILWGSNQLSNGPIFSAGEVLVKSGR